MSRTIFYSWQSDISPSKHRYFIEQCLKNALEELEQDVNIYMEYDRDTVGVKGSPDISQTIFEKIDKSVLFVCDISIINSTCQCKKTPNPNVLMELGYAVNKLGWERVICLFDANTGEIEDLPFDIRQKRVTVFNPDKGKTEKKRVTDIIKINIKDLFLQGKLFNPLDDYMKGRIDKAILDVLNPMANLLFGTYSMSDGLAHVKDLLEMKYEIILDRMPLCEFPGFIVLNTYDSTEKGLCDILKELLGSSYFPKEWSYTVLELLDWLRGYKYIVSKHGSELPIEYTDRRSYSEIAVISAKALNESNPLNSMVVLETYEKDGTKYVDTQSGKVINTTTYNCLPGELSKCFVVKPQEYQAMSKRIHKLIGICRQWLDLNDNEFILDPEYYQMK